MPAPSVVAFTAQPSGTGRHFDLGGPCEASHTGETHQQLVERLRRVHLTGAEEEKLRKDRDWLALIEAAKREVRDNCSVPYRWESLFMVLVEAHLYREAIQILEEMEARGFPMPHLSLSKSGAGFLESGEFNATRPGARFAQEESDMQRLLRTADAALKSMPEKDRPPELYKSIGACPFECCTYGEWGTEEAIQLHEAIGSTKIIAEVPAGHRVVALTGEVWLEPEPYVALKENGVLKPGDVIFFLDYEGEGAWNLWFKGSLNPKLAFNDVPHMFLYEECTSNNQGPRACSLRKLYPEKKFRYEWWVKVRTPDGKEGWVVNTGQFSNTDSCA